MFSFHVEALSPEHWELFMYLCGHSSVNMLHKNVNMSSFQEQKSSPQLAAGFSEGGVVSPESHRM